MQSGFKRLWVELAELFPKLGVKILHDLNELHKDLLLPLLKKVLLGFYQRNYLFMCGLVLAKQDLLYLFKILIISCPFMTYTLQTMYYVYNNTTIAYIAMCVLYSPLL